MTRTERLLRLARLRGDRAAELILCHDSPTAYHACTWGSAKCWWCKQGVRMETWTEAELRAAWGDR